LVSTKESYIKIPLKRECKVKKNTNQRAPKANTSSSHHHKQRPKKSHIPQVPYSRIYSAQKKHKSTKNIINSNQLKPPPTKNPPKQKKGNAQNIKAFPMKSSVNHKGKRLHTKLGINLHNFVSTRQRQSIIRT
jgi:hypothetical protein